MRLCSLSTHHCHLGMAVSLIGNTVGHCVFVVAALAWLRLLHWFSVWGVLWILVLPCRLTAGCSWLRSSCSHWSSSCFLYCGTCYRQQPVQANTQHAWLWQEGSPPSQVYVYSCLGSMVKLKDAWKAQIYTVNLPGQLGKSASLYLLMAEYT